MPDEYGTYTSESEDTTWLPSPDGDADSFAWSQTRDDYTWTYDVPIDDAVRFTIYIL